MSESPRQAASPSAIADWQRGQLPRWRAQPPAPPVTDQVTALAYCFWPPARMAEQFFTIEAAFRATWEQCGRLRSKIVASHRFPELDAFCGQEGVAVDLAPELSGRLSAMSRDCIANLHARFDTPYVLVIQNDGFPLRSGLGAFVGPYDYIGAPWGPSSWYTRLVFPHPRFSVGNGGFSLRSRRLCERASWYFRRKYRLIPYCYAVVDDVFYCRVLPRFEPGIRRLMKYAPPEVAGRFSCEAYDGYYPRDGEMPFGFHTVNGFNRVRRDFSGRVAAWLGNCENNG